MHGLELGVCPTGFETFLKFSPGVGNVPQWPIYTLTLNVITFRLLNPYRNGRAVLRPGKAPGEGNPRGGYVCYLWPLALPVVALSWYSQD